MYNFSFLLLYPLSGSVVFLAKQDLTLIEGFSNEKIGMS